MAIYGVGQTVRHSFQPQESKPFAQILDATIDVRTNYTFPDRQMTPSVRHFLEAAPGLRFTRQEIKKLRLSAGVQDAAAVAML